MRVPRRWSCCWIVLVLGCVAWTAAAEEKQPAGSQPAASRTDDRLNREFEKSLRSAADFLKELPTDPSLIPAAPKEPAPSAAPAKPAAPPVADEYLDRGDFQGCLRAAEDFLKASPKAPAAPRVAMDALICATLAKDATRIGELRGRLLLEYPDSVYTGYLLSTLADASSFRGVLDAAVTKGKDVLSQDFSGRYCQAVWLAVNNQMGLKGSVLQDKTFAHQTALMAEIAGDYRLKGLCLETLAKFEEPKDRALAEAAFAGEKKPMARLLDVHRVADDATGRLYERYFYSKLSDQERELPEPVRIIIEGLLGDDKFSEALPVIAKLLKQGDAPQLLFWQAWANSAVGNTAESLKVLSAIRTQHTQSPWAEKARQLEDRVRNAEEYAKVCAAIVPAVLGRLWVKGVDTVEATVVYQPDEGSPWEAYVALACTQCRLEVMLSRNGKPRMAYRADKTSGKVLLDGEPTIYEFLTGAVYPAPGMRLNITPDGKCTGTWGVQPAASLDKGAGLTRILADATSALDESKVMALQQEIRSSGWLPAKVETKDQVRVFRWLRPSLDEKKDERLELHLKDDTVVYVCWNDRLEVKNLQYGPAGQFELSPPKWPDLPVVTREKSDPALIFRLLGNALALLCTEEKDLAQKPAAGPK